MTYITQALTELTTPAGGVNLAALRARIVELAAVAGETDPKATATAEISEWFAARQSAQQSAREWEARGRRLDGTYREGRRA